MDDAVYQRRPDLIGISVLVLLGVTLLRPRKLLAPMCLAVGVLFALGALVHEATAVYAIPWALVMVAVMATRQLESPPSRSARLMRLLALVAVPALVVLVAVAMWGRASPTKVEALERGASFLHIGTRPDGTPKVTAIDFLADDPAAAVDRVGAVPQRDKVGSVVLAVFLVAVQAAWLWRWVHPRLWSRLAEAGPLIAATGWIAVAGSAVALFALGVDWLRWIALIGTAWLITCAFAVLTAKGPVERTDRVEVPTILVVVAVYLAAIAPLDALTQLGVVSRTLSLR
jgi:hypothetical protein